jgi:hypothetical protein
MSDLCDCGAGDSPVRCCCLDKTRAAQDLEDQIRIRHGKSAERSLEEPSESLRDGKSNGHRFIDEGLPSLRCGQLEG